MEISDKYKSITDGINGAQERGILMSASLDKMKTDLSSSEILTADIDRIKLDNYIDSTSGTVTLFQVQYSVNLLTFVAILQKHITDEYTSVDTFLSDNKIKVKSTFADISDRAGFPIVFGNISNTS